MKTECVAVAFLCNNDSYLLMKRSEHKKHYPNIWDGVGGKVENEELREPEKAVIREIYEESGIKQNNITNLKLKYVHILMNKDLLIYHYIYFGDSNFTDVWQTDEGTLFWIPRQDFFNRVFSPQMRVILNHYFNVGINSDLIYSFSYQGNNEVLIPIQCT